jgi:hypothetical protein
MIDSKEGCRIGIIAVQASVVKEVIVENVLVKLVTLAIRPTDQRKILRPKFPFGKGQKK